MTTDTSDRWPSRKIGPDQVLTSMGDDSHALLAIGPGRGALEPDQRMRDVLEALAPALHCIRWGRQIHGRIIASIASEPHQRLAGSACVGRCDGLITAEGGIGLVVWSADCVPVLMSGGGVVAAVHAGWRGTAQDIVAAAVSRFRSEYGVPAPDLHVVIGPAISGPHYEVGTEVIENLEKHDVDEALWRAGRNVDLRAFLAGRLRALGVRPPSIDVVGGCTFSSSDLASFRRDGAAAGRQWSLIYRPAGPSSE